MPSGWRCRSWPGRGPAWPWSWRRCPACAPPGSGPAAWSRRLLRIPSMDERLQRLSELIAVVELLRGPDGCPWDREQTHASLRSTLLEEAYEVLAAIDGGAGDVLLQVLMHAEIARQAGEFELGDVADAVREKLVRRHPHVFGSVVVSGSEEVVRNWEALKAAEYGRVSALDGVQRSLPALQWAWSLQKRAQRVGFDWPDVEGAVEKVGEEVAELRQASTVEESAAEFGDLLFALVNVARRLEINPEDALRTAAQRFEARFRLMEGGAQAEGVPLSGMSLAELDRRWEAAKAAERDDRAPDLANG